MLASAESQILEVQGHREETPLLHARPSCFLALNPQRQAFQGQSSRLASTSTGSGSPHPEAGAGLGDVPAAQTGKLRHGACPEAAGVFLGPPDCTPSGRGVEGWVPEGEFCSHRPPDHHLGRVGGGLHSTHLEVSSTSLERERETGPLKRS